MNIFIIISLITLSSSYYSNTFWEKLNFPPNISISSLIITDSNIILAATPKGIYLSRDKGLNWQISNSGLKCLDVRDFAIGQNRNIYAGTTEGIYKSTNSGQTWELLGFKNKYISCIKINSKGVIYICGPYITVRFSSNNGKSWEKPIAGLDENSANLKEYDIYSIDIKSDSIIFAGAYSISPFSVPGIFRSTDFGKTWKKTSNGLKSQEIDCIGVSPNGNVYVGAGQVFDGHINGIYLSTDNGDNWKQIYEMNCGECYPNTLNTSFNQSVFMGSMGSGVIYFTDNGKSWEDLNGDKIIRIVSSIVKDSKNYVYIGTEQDGLFRSIIPYK